MLPSVTGKAYDEITHLWDRENFNENNGIAQHQRALAFVESRDKALDIGCGCSSRIIDFLTTSGFTYEGLDVSEKMISLARQHHPNIVFHHQDMCEWKSTEQYDFITAWDSIWHVPLALHEQVISNLIYSLTAGGVLIFSFGGTEEPNEHTNELMGPTVYYSTLGTKNYLKLVTRMGCIFRHFEYDQYPEQHAYIIAQKPV